VNEDGRENKQQTVGFDQSITSWKGKSSSLLLQKRLQHHKRKREKQKEREKPLLPAPAYSTKTHTHKKKRQRQRQVISITTKPSKGRKEKTN
jgi:hypothetical protein